ncbi:MAG: Holliday junction branch migration protein RuvA, partial [Betaproteobacteria bacterium]|nr:Holliday junction branch migration protein RuvA [Betaproteobacteria bacterium]
DDRLEVQRALMALGYSEKESAQAIHAIAPGTNLSEGIRQALKQLSKGSLQ